MGTVSKYGQQLDYWVAHAIDTIKQDLGIYANTEVKRKDLNKFGQNDSLTQNSWDTIWNVGGNETYATGNTINQISSSDDGDDQEITIECHVLGDDGFSFIVQNVTLNGQTPVSLPQSVARVSRAYNADSTEFQGTVYVFESGGTVTNGVPQDATKIHAQMPTADQQTNKCAGTMSKQDCMIITGLNCFANKKAAGQIDFQLQVRQYGKTFRTVYRCTSSSGGAGALIRFEPYLVVPPNADFRVRGNANASGMSGVASLNSILALVVRED